MDRKKTPAELLEFLSAQAAQKNATADDHLILATFHLHRGDDREALSSYTLALKLEVRNASAWFERARIEARMLDFSAALLSLYQAATASPPRPLMLDMTKLKGRILLRLGRNEEALIVWRDLVTKHAGDEYLVEEVIDLFADESQFEAAIENSQALIKKTRDPLARTLR